MVGRARGLTAGWILTSKMDRHNTPPAEHIPTSLIPRPAALVATDRTGATTLVPALSLSGRY